MLTAGGTAIQEAKLDPVRSAPFQSDDPDLPALLRIVRGEPNAYAEIVGRHESVLRKVVIGIMADDHLSQDVLQDVFMTGYRKLASFRGECHFGGWLYRIAVRKAQRARSQRKRWWSMPLTVTEKESNRAESADQLRLVLGLLEKLPVRQRTALVLHILEEKSYQEIAELLRCTTGTVGSLIHRARQKLMREAGPEHQVKAPSGSDFVLETPTP